MKKLFILLLVSSFSYAQKNVDFTTVFETSKGTETATYTEIIQFYKDLAATYSEITIQEIGETDAGKPLHIVTLNPDKIFDYSTIRKNKRILFINNGIHPGESDGIDATMLLFRDIVQGKIKAPTKTVLVTIPIYNVGGSLNRNSTTRTNQNGPIAYGFRGNARNYDLNRDFIKCDTKNARTFTQIFHLVQPDVFVDTHVSNGADYQYTLTHLFTQHNKLGGVLGKYLHQEMMPKLEKNLAKKKWDITPYVNVFNQVPEIGFSQFLDSPRYSTGYTTLFNTLGMMVETHMLKPYQQRVEGTYELLKSMLVIIEIDAERIKNLRADSYKNFYNKINYPIAWKIDTTKNSTLTFKGFEGHRIPSKITGEERLKFDKNKPFTKNITYQNYFIPKLEVTIPSLYIIPQAWHRVIDLLQLNAIQMTRLKKDTTITVEAYKISNFQTRKMTYEGHYLHYDTKINTSIKNIDFNKGDYLINTFQPLFRYLMETLEPQAPDSFFNWNFFDTILQQKEGFSPYVWEDKALEILENNSKLKKEFLAKKKADQTFANNWFLQLDWIHKHSAHYETAHMHYPVFRVLK